MNKNDLIAFKIATLPINIDKDSTHNLLKKLEIKYPENYEIKRQIALWQVENGCFETGIIKMSFLCVKFKKFTDFALLFSITFFKGTFKFYFEEMNFIEMVKSREERDFLKKTYEKLLKYECKFKIPKRAIENCNLEYLNMNKDNIYGNEYQFNIKYRNIIKNINKGKIKEALEQSILLFSTKTIFDSIQMMVDNEKIELLYQFSRKNQFFSKYYQLLQEKMHKSFIKVFETAILIKSDEMINNLADLLEEKKDYEIKRVRDDMILKV